LNNLKLKERITITKEKKRAKTSALKRKVDDLSGT
jgi:hypothetical protein